MQDTINSVFWLPAKGAAFNTGPAPYTAPKGHEVMVRARAVAINPFDRHLQTIGALACPWLIYPMVVGHDVAGDVVGLAGGSEDMAMHAAGVPADKLVATI